MDRRKRAKIFAPFDALDGYSESIEEKNIEYVERIEQDPAAKAELNRRLRILQSLTYNSRIARENIVVISVRYYVPCTDTNRFVYSDARKSRVRPIGNHCSGPLGITFNQLDHSPCYEEIAVKALPLLRCLQP